MRKEQLTKCFYHGEVGIPLNGFKPARNILYFITERSNAVFLIWFSAFACFGVSFCPVFTSYLDDI